MSDTVAETLAGQADAVRARVEALLAFGLPDEDVHAHNEFFRVDPAACHATEFAA